MKPSKLTQGRTQKEESWKYEWEAREVVVATQGLSRMKSGKTGKGRRYLKRGGGLVKG
jgi:predicted flavoprotein YhiN